MPLTAVTPVTRMQRGKNSTDEINSRLTELESRMNALDALQKPTYAVSGLPAAAAGNAGVVVRCSNGNAGSACLALSDGTNWKVIAIGATVSAS